MTILKQFTIRLTMESDWHVGAGMGRPGNVDRLITRDADDLPFVPAKSLRGIWRDACERLCWGLDNGSIGPWSKLVDCLFGSQPSLGPNDPTGRHDNPAEPPQESSVQIRSARIPTPLREQLKAEERLDPYAAHTAADQATQLRDQLKAEKHQLIRQALTFVKPGVKIDRRSGSAQTNMLRFEEMGRTGTILEAECILNVSDQLTRELGSALLIASAKLVERLGGKRRRGPGRCCLEIIGADTDAAIAWLEQTESVPECSFSKESAISPETPSTAQQNDPWIFVPLQLELNGPLAVSYRTTGNVVETLDFLPGSYLLPHITRTFPELRSSVPSGDVVILPAYPEVDGERAQPVPLALFSPKGIEKPLESENRELVINRLLKPELDEDKQPKQMRVGYVSQQPTKVYKTPTTVRTHNTVQDESQRPTEVVGGVYSYEAIAPSDHGTPVVLRSELRIRKSLADHLEANWWNKLSGEVSFGRSKKDDYGSVSLIAESPEDCVSSPLTAANNTNELFVWLVSDTLVRNSQLRPEPTASCLGEELSRRLGITLRVRKDNDILRIINGEEKFNPDELLHEFVRIRRLDTWHVGWGLPRPSLVALQAGSCMVFQVEGTVDPAKLAQLEASGIGERTAEGYGQVRFNHPLIAESLPQVHSSTSAKNGSPEKPKLQKIAKGHSSFDFARLIERECWKQEIRRACLEFANLPQDRDKELGWVASGEQGKPPMSQLGGLRSQIATLRTINDLPQVIAWLDHLAGNDNRLKKWPGKTRNEWLASIQKIKSFISEPIQIWNIVKTDDWPTLTINADSELKQELWAFAVRTFFDACIRAHKRELEKQQERKEATHGA
ncbi:MAG: RAMP superfamily CRISPR-associated protein [Zavarzinella sp.]